MNAERMTRNAWTAAYLRAALDNIKEYGASPAVETAVARAFVAAYGEVNPVDEKAAYDALLSAICGPNAAYHTYYDTDSLIIKEGAAKKNLISSATNPRFAAALKKAMGGQYLDPIKTPV